MSLPPLAEEQRLKPARFELRMSLIYGALFTPLGVHLPYFPLWLEAQGYSADQIAIVLSAPMFLRVVTTPIVTALADRVRDRLTVFLALNAAAVAFSAGYFLKPSYVVVLLVSLLLQAAWTPLSPLADSLTLSGVRRYAVSYAGLRIWGSIAYLVGNFGGGVVVSRLGTGTVPVMLTIGLAAAFGAALLGPRLGRPRVSSPLSATTLQEAAASPFSLPLILFFVGAGLISGSHAFLHGFVSIYWKSIGVEEWVVGLLWAWAVGAEVMVFMTFRRLFGGYRPTTLLAISGVTALLRWLLFPLIWPTGLGIPGFFVIQTTHALSTGLMLIAVQVMIARSVDERRVGAAQGLAFFMNGFANATVTLISGPLYSAFGIGGIWLMAIPAAVGLLLLVPSARQPQRAGSGG